MSNASDANAKVDPYWALAMETGCVDFDPSLTERFPVLLECRPDRLPEIAKALATEGVIEEFYLQKDMTYASASVTRAGHARLVAHDAATRVEFAPALACGRPRPNTAGVALLPPVVEADLEAEALFGADTLLAVIDDGCPFAHASLRASAPRYTRIRAIWDQNEDANFAGLGGSATGFSYGVEVSRRYLVACMLEASRGATIDESFCYHLAGYAAVKARMSHGAHSIGRLLQGGRCAPECAENDIVFVQLPQKILDVPSHAAMCRYILDAVAWVLLQRKANEKKVVISIGYVSPLGAHDGSSIFEEALAQLVNRCSNDGIALQIVLAAGNDYEACQHAVIEKLAQGESFVLPIQIVGESEVATFVELWVPSDCDDVVIALAAPSDPPATIYVQLTASGSQPPKVVGSCAIIDSCWRAADGARLVLIRIAPTMASRFRLSALTGMWRISISTERTLSQPLHAYLSRARGSIGTIVRGNQSKFVLVPRLSEDAKKGTLSGIACGSGTLVVGGVNRWANWVPAKYTASGPSRNSGRIGPDYSVATEDSPSLTGVQSMGNRSGEMFRMGGTSVAAPYIAGFAACFPSLPSPNEQPQNLRVGTAIASKWY